MYSYHKTEGPQSCHVFYNPTIDLDNAFHKGQYSTASSLKVQSPPQALNQNGSDNGDQEVLAMLIGFYGL